ncbi:restriction endonuclease subunit S [Herbaspirillum sp. NPDC101396]|uniref:restriction endonuclease subunit S n=1 Tax=Herbaspirillum sp. NPDC101396 TaxID=3364005 RepID=UPI00383B00DD
MSSDWPLTSIAQLAGDWKGSMAVGPFGSRMKADLYVSSGVRVIRGNNLNGCREPEGDYVFVSEETADSLASCCVEPGDLVFPHRGNIGEVGITPDDGYRYMLSTSLMKLSPDRTKVDPLYLMYYFKSPIGRAALLMNASQVGTPGIATPLKSLRGIQLSLPPLELQRRIAATLSILDDRITLLRDTNATLEALAEATFKSWFVDFDPVRAKGRGQIPEGMDEMTATLFPRSFDESGLGSIPAGWGVGTIDDLLELAYGKALKSTDRIEGSIPVYGSGGITGFHNESLVAGPSIIVGRKGTVGSLYWEDRPFFPIDTVFYVRTTRPLTYCFYLLKTLGLENMNTDGAVPGLNRNNVYRLNVVMPSKPILQAFDGLVTIFRTKISSNNERIKSLATLRDSLLPRLISGQIRISEIEYTLNRGEAT